MTPALKQDVEGKKRPGPVRLVIISDGDAPQARMVAIVRDGKWTYLSNWKRLSHYSKWSFLDPAGWVTPIDRFGVRARVSVQDGETRLVLHADGESVARYPDGVPRRWQRDLPDSTPIRPKLIDLVRQAIEVQE